MLSRSAVFEPSSAGQRAQASKQYWAMPIYRERRWSSLASHHFHADLTHS
jgi:hypothetical protein